jgi:ABC-type bacteriocin/lantibiotic exporter with double-glycine peptidase domain
MASLRKFFAPEVVQTSNMDCGPAALKCLLNGYGIRADYGRLREACQTDVDGTSIDTIEDAARQLGLDAEQIMVPADHAFSSASLLPAIVIVRLPGAGATHFLVVWRKIGPFLQVMDPATGRRWTTVRRLTADLYRHPQPVPADGWREWAGTEEFTSVLARRLRQTGIRYNLAEALADPSWKSLAAADAAARACAALRLPRLFPQLLAQPDLIPPTYWTVQPLPDNHLLFRGAVMVKVRGAATEAAPAKSAELDAALHQPSARPGWELLKLLRQDGFLAPFALLLTFLLAAAGVLLEAGLFRGLLDLGRELGLGGQRLGAIAAIAGLLALMLCLEWPAAGASWRLGRHLETRLRRTFLERIPRLGDRYFSSRLNSDMAERGHAIHRIRNLPELGSQFVRASLEMALTTAAIAWLDPAGAWMAVSAAAISLALPLLLQPIIVERDLRVRNHAGGLSRFYLDALLGLVPIRAHGAEMAVRREHGRLLTQWASASYRLQSSVVATEAISLTLSYSLAIALIWSYLDRQAESGSVLLLVYWVLALPAQAQEIALAAWQYPSQRNTALRLLEPLSAKLEEPSVPATVHAAEGGAALSLRNVTVRAGGHQILQNLSVEIQPGSQVAIVGASGAGKSSFAGLFLGWHRAASGEILVDGQPLHLESLRAQTAWVDPSVQLWNRSLLDNLLYGNGPAAANISSVVAEADLTSVLESLPHGLESPLGESGALVSGGEGQRVRLGRAWLRPDARLVILDEPFRGLGLDQRKRLLERARAHWKQATILCITHDIRQTLTFERVLVIDGGRLVEDGDPSVLALRDGSRYGDLLQAEQAVKEEFWSGSEWRRIRMDAGSLRPVPAPPAGQVTKSEAAG